MSWTTKFAVVFEAEELIGRAELDAHLAAIESPEGAEFPRPPAQLEPDDELGAAQWNAGLLHGELLAFLGLRERQDQITVVRLGPGTSAALRDREGRPLAMFASPELLDDAELLALLATRELLLVGSADRLWALAKFLDTHGVELTTLAMIIDHVPTLPAAAALLHERFAAPVGEGLRDESGGWLALARHRGELLLNVRARESLRVTTPSGDQLGAGQWGLLGTKRDGQANMLPVCARLQTNRDGHPGVELGVPATPLGSSSRPSLNTVDLHDLLGTLPVFAYHVRFDIGGNRLDISLLPDRDDEQTRATILEAIAPGVETIEVVFAKPVVEFPATRVYDGRGIFRGRVLAVWAGEPGSATRRAAWRQALNVASAGGRKLSVVDAESGEPLVGAERELVAELVTELMSEREHIPKLFETGDIERVVWVGDAQREFDHASSTQGWISLMPGDDELEPMFIAGVEREEVRAVQALFESGTILDGLSALAVDGVSFTPFSRPVLGRARDSADDDRVIWVDDERCVGSGDCVRICPTDAIELVSGLDAERGSGKTLPVIDTAACIRCHLCCERCDVLALRPIVSDDAAFDGRLLVDHVDRLRGVRRRVQPRALDGKLVEPPAALDPRVKAEPATGAPATIKRKPTVVLGLATVTLMEHAAALLVDGELVSAIEEERLARVRHYTWKHPERPGTSLSSDICLRVEEAWPPRAIEAVLRTAGLTMDDVDLVAINGIPARCRHSFIGGGGWRPPPVLRANSVVFVPHHMSHAACVYGLSDYDDAWILSIDGRGDYETATVWRAEGHALEVIDAVPWLPDCSFGGVYETVTRVLGFGSHGQGSTMALAALGEPSIDLSACMSLDERGAPILSEWAAEKLFDQYERAYDGPMTDAHRNLAASMQRALELTVGDYLAHHAGELRGQNLAMCGGVALNCRMNGILRDRFAPKDMYVAPAANDAGTAIGAAVIGHRELTGELPRLGLGHTHLGPQWSDDAIARSLERMRVPFQRLREVGAQTAELIASGKIVCWFQGPMEFGPRALGGRSILADPRREDLKERLNVMKSRQSWRPFGSSVLAGHQGQWFEQDWDTRFMLFAVDVRPEKRDQIPVVVHFDGSTRPQIVHAEHHPRYHALIAAFNQRTGIPMVVNTSFNRGGEPIVCNPAEAMRSFVGLGADAIVLGNCLVRRELLRRR